MAHITRRAAAAAVITGVLVIAGFGASSASADPPPLVWTTMGGFPLVTVDDVTVTFDTASSTFSPFDSSEEMREPMPVFRPEVTNNSAETKYFGFGTDLVTQGTIGELWLAGAWGAFDGFARDACLPSNFWFPLAPGESLSTSGSSAAHWYDGMPSWSGHTIRVFELSEAPSDAVTPIATPIASISSPGGFVPADLSQGDLSNISAVMGQRATVSGAPGVPELFAGLTATVEASGLTPGESMELWIAPNLNYAYFQVLGGGLPISAIHLRDETVAADGTLSATITLPSDIPLGSYQLVAGDSAERYWPAGSYDDFTVTTPTATSSAPSAAGASTAALAVGPTHVTLDYPAGTTAGTTTVTVSGTGPAVDGFRLITDPPLYYHIDTTATLGGPATVCISFDPAQFAQYPPQLFHFDTTLNRWVDITTSRAVGSVCGLTSTFSPFALGLPPLFDFSGFLAPVSTDEPNLVNPGQAIPVKFSLGGDKGLGVVVSARFVSHGTVANPVGDTIDAVTAGGAALSYSAKSDQYTYVWKTQKAWAEADRPVHPDPERRHEPRLRRDLQEVGRGRPHQLRTRCGSRCSTADRDILSEVPARGCISWKKRASPSSSRTKRTSGPCCPRSCRRPVSPCMARRTVRTASISSACISPS